MGELLTIIDEKFGLEFVAGGNPGIVSGLMPTLAQDEPAGCCPGPADLPGLLSDFEAGVIRHPFGLVTEEELWGWDDFGFHGCGWFSGYNVFK